MPHSEQNTPRVIAKNFSHISQNTSFGIVLPLQHIGARITAVTIFDESSSHSLMSRSS